jgi:hypothetical protein
MQHARNGLWVLLLNRDLDQFSSQAVHRLYLQRPERSDPRWSDRQLVDVADACEEVQYEAREKNLEVAFMRSPEEIARQILSTIDPPALVKH